MTTEIYSKYDNIKITIQFGQSRSSNYKKAIRLCKQFPNHNLIEYGAEINECCIISLDEYCQYNSMLDNLMIHICNWKSTKVFIDSLIVNAYEIRDIRHDIEIQLRNSKIKKNRFRYSLLIGEIVIEDLPYPVVYYPGHYGTFIAFSESEDSVPALCNCSEEAVKQYISINRNGLLSLNSDFPSVIINRIRSALDPLNSIVFEESICHKCNMAVPSPTYCHEMYGSKFIQKYGWYVNQNRYKLVNHFVDSKIGFRKEVENYTRQEFGFRKIGDRWISETTLYQIVSRIFKDEEILRHYRPNWLEGLELDIFIPRHNVAFEYQGQQHFHSVKAWGGLPALKSQQERDRKKLEICKILEVQLYVIDYREPLTEKYIREIIK